MPDFYLIYFIIVASFVWFNTDAAAEYLALFGSKFHRNFLEEKRSSGITYEMYLLIKANSFCVRLITCTYCLIVWLNLAAGLAASILSPNLFEWKHLGANILFSWIGYLAVAKAVKKLNE